MSNALDNEVEEALREYLEVIDMYHKLVDECVSVLGPGVSRLKLKLITTETLQDLRETKEKVTKAREKLRETIRRLHLER